MKVWFYILRRMVSLVFVMGGVLIIIFVMGHVIPANPLHFFIGQESDEAYVAQVRAELHLDDPIWKQFGFYVSDLLHGDLGMSWSTRNPVAADLAIRLPATFELITVSLIVCVLLAFPLGVVAAVKRDTWIDHSARVTSLLGVALPSFWLGLLLIYVFFYRLRILPPPMGRMSIGTNIRQVTGFYLIDTLLAGDLDAFGNVVRFMVLPVTALSFAKMGQLTRLVRSTMIETLGSTYIEAARAQGLRKWLIHYRLALKNAVLPPITQIGLIWGNLIGGAVIVEIVFAWPGAGSWAVDAALAGDYAPIQAFAIIMAAARVIIFLITDILYLFIDPRIRY